MKIITYELGPAISEELVKAGSVYADELYDILTRSDWNMPGMPGLVKKITGRADKRRDAELGKQRRASAMAKARKQKMMRTVRQNAFEKNYRPMTPAQILDAIDREDAGFDKLFLGAVGAADWEDLEQNIYVGDFFEDGTIVPDMGEVYEYFEKQLEGEGEEETVGAARFAELAKAACEECSQNYFDNYQSEPDYDDRDDEDMAHYDRYGW